MPSPACEVEGGRLSGLPFDSTGALYGDHKGQQSAPYLTRGLRNPACRRTATAVLHGRDTCPTAYRHHCHFTQDHLVHAALLITADSPAHSFLSPVSVAHREDMPLRGVKRGLSTSVGDAVRSRGANQMWEKKPASVSLLWSPGLIASPRRPSTSAGSGPRDPGHSESLCHGSAEQDRRARAPWS